MSRSKHANGAAAVVPVTSPTQPSEIHDRKIELALLLEPVNAARESFDETALSDLAESMKEVGLITPLAVEPEGDKFRIHAGHRRYIAAIGLGWKDIRCSVFPPGMADGEAIKVHENRFRETVNPGHEAKYFARLLDSHCGGDVDVLCAKTKMSRSYVEGRLLLLQGDERVFAALNDDAISIGVAQELNKVTSRADRWVYLEAAMTGGASVRMVREWRTRANGLLQLNELATDAPPQLPSNTAIATIMTMLCFLCNSAEDTYEMELLYVHKRCRRMFLDNFLRRLHGEDQTKDGEAS